VGNAEHFVMSSEFETSVMVDLETPVEMTGGSLIAVTPEDRRPACQ
jgi:hypothetical protein